MSKLIPPTPGRVVWYWPSQQEIDARSFSYEDPTQPLAATVAYVHSDRLVNLSVTDQIGAQFRRTSVKLLQEDDERPHTSEGPFATWMPYQLGQAAKAAEAEAPAAEQQPVVAVDLAAPGADQTVETKVYADGTSATGVAPLPDQSPAAKPANEIGDAGLFFPVKTTEDPLGLPSEAEVVHVWGDTCVNLRLTETDAQLGSVLVFASVEAAAAAGCAGYFFVPGASLSEPAAPDAPTFGQSPIQQIADDAVKLADAVAGLPPEAGDADPSKDDAAQA